MDRGRIIKSRKDNLIMAISGKPCCVLGTMVYIARDDYQQGATVKIMFIHVPAAWLGMFAWGVMSAAALGTPGLAASARRCGRQNRGASLNATLVPLRWPQSANPQNTAMKPRYAGKYRLDDQDMQDDYDQTDRNEYADLSERIIFFCSTRSLPNILSNGLSKSNPSGTFGFSGN